ncbi:MAG: tyrosine-type recombinase/integrase [Planctomycetota bacterium]
MSVHRINTGKTPRWIVKYRRNGTSRSLTVSRKNLARHGLAYPDSEERITKRHAQALEASVQRVLLLHQESPLPDGLISTRGSSSHRPKPAPKETVREAIEAHLAQLHASDRHALLKRRWLLGPKPKTKPEGATPGLAAYIGELAVHQVTADDLAPFRASLSGDAPNPIMGALRATRSFFNWCVATKRRDDNPARAFPLPRARPSMPKFLTPEETSTLLEAARGREIERAFRLILGLGLRRQEALALQWEDVRPETSVVVVRRKLKTAHAYREVPLPTELYRYLRRSQGERSSSHVLHNDDGGALTEHQLARWLTLFKAETSLPFEFSYQICRATYGSFLITAGFQIAEVSRFLGHSSTEITEGWYFGLRVSLYSDRINEAFSGGLLSTPTSVEDQADDSSQT